MDQRQPHHWGVLLIVSMAIFILTINSSTMNVSLNAL